MFDLASASVVCGLAPEAWTPPAEFGTEDGLLIGSQDGTAYILFESGKITMKFGTTTIECDATNVKQTVSGVFTTLRLHTHAGVGLPPTPNT